MSVRLLGWGVGVVWVVGLGCRREGGMVGAEIGCITWECGLWVREWKWCMYVAV